MLVVDCVVDDSVVNVVVVVDNVVIVEDVEVVREVKVVLVPR